VYSSFSYGCTYVVHDLSPAHVDVVAGLGDSITVSHMLCGVPNDT
jgi:hypothetical protein